MFRPSLRVAYLAVAFSLKTKATIPDAIELLALCMLALVRYSSPTGNMMLGQVKAKAKRMQQA